MSISVSDQTNHYINLLSTARSLIANRQGNDAIPLCNTVLTSCSDASLLACASKLMSQCLVMFRQHKEAQVFEQLSVRYLDDAAAILIRDGIKLGEEGAVAQAETNFSRAIEFTSNCELEANAYYCMAAARKALQAQPEKVMECCRKVVSLTTDIALRGKAFLGWARLCFEMGHFQDAISRVIDSLLFVEEATHCQKSLQFLAQVKGAMVSAGSPSSLEFLRFKADEARIHAGNFEKDAQFNPSLVFYDLAALLAVEVEQKLGALHDKARLLTRLGLHDSAIKEYTSIINETKSNAVKANAHYNIAMIYRSKRQYVYSTNHFALSSQLTADLEAKRMLLQESEQDLSMELASFFA